MSALTEIFRDLANQGIHRRPSFWERVGCATMMLGGAVLFLTFWVMLILGGMTMVKMTGLLP